MSSDEHDVIPNVPTYAMANAQKELVFFIIFFVLLVNNVSTHGPYTQVHRGTGTLCTLFHRDKFTTYFVKSFNDAPALFRARLLQTVGIVAELMLINA